MLLSAARENTGNVKNYVKPPPKPDDEGYKAALEDIQNKLNAITDKINNVSENGPAENKREELFARLDKLRGKQAETKRNRSNIFEQLKSMNESLQKKKRDLQQSKNSVQYRSIKEIDNAIENYERQIESGTLKIIDEKKIIANISNLKKSKKSVKLFETQKNAIEEEQKKIDELKKTLDDSDFKKNNEEYDDVKAQLETVSKDCDLNREKRNELFDEKKRLTAQKREIQEQYNKSKQEYRKYQEEENKRRQELKRKQAQERENQYKKEVMARKREEAAVPAFQLDILNCENLINYFESLNGGTGKSAQLQSSPTAPVDSNIRQPDATSNVPEGTVLMKKSDRGDDYFIGGGKKHKKSQKEKKSSKSNVFPLSFSIMEQLTSLDVAVPLNSSEIEQTIESLFQKKKYFIENQDRVTKENMEKVEAEIAAMEENGFGHHKKKGNSNYINNNEKKDKSDDKNEDDSTFSIAKDEEKVEDVTENEKKEETPVKEEETDASW
ncbi:unnamed protein product [Rhizophagus irregularis]|nr:unnamed protein product [Rhizophagus irregularis]